MKQEVVVEGDKENKERSIWVFRSIIWNKHYLDFEIS